MYVLKLLNTNQQNILHEKLYAIENEVLLRETKDF